MILPKNILGTGHHISPGRGRGSAIYIDNLGVSKEATQNDAIYSWNHEKVGIIKKKFKNVSVFIVLSYNYSSFWVIIYLN